MLRQLLIFILLNCLGLAEKLFTVPKQEDSVASCIAKRTGAAFEDQVYIYTGFNIQHWSQPTPGSLYTLINKSTEPLDRFRVGQIIILKTNMIFKITYEPQGHIQALSTTDTALTN